MLFCKIYIAFFAHERVGHMIMYFPKYLIGNTLAACFAVVILKISGKVHDHVSNPFMREGGNLYATK